MNLEQAKKAVEEIKLDLDAWLDAAIGEDRLLGGGSDEKNNSFIDDIAGVSQLFN